MTTDVGVECTTSLIEQIARKVSQVGGVRAVVLGGSRARGTHTPESDIDIGIYYDPRDPLDLVGRNRLATDIDDRHLPDLLTPIGGWGPWIIGGGWLTVGGRSVDFIYRDLRRVEESIDDCHAGRVDIHLCGGHPHGFLTSTYAAEVSVCRPLWQSEGEIDQLRKRTTPYPAALKAALIARFNWEIDFSLFVARKSIPRQDVTHAAGSCFRSVSCMLEVLFALNEQYWLNEKGAVAAAEAFPLRPGDFRARVERAFSLLSADAHAIKHAIEVLTEVASEITSLSGSALP